MRRIIMNERDSEAVAAQLDLEHLQSVFAKKKKVKPTEVAKPASTKKTKVTTLSARALSTPSRSTAASSLGASSSPNPVDEGALPPAAPPPRTRSFDTSASAAASPPVAAASARCTAVTASPGSGRRRVGRGRRGWSDGG